MKHYPRRGDDHHQAKLTDHDVELIRQLHEEGGLTHRELAEKFDCSRQNISAIVNYRSRTQAPKGDNMVFE